ncbi:MAG TPA: hypothetical protein VN376_09930 [Longilinea sp.]|nr:hypothetical protein [Longilinea sp.]
MSLAIEDYEQVLYRRYYDALRWRNLWTILIFALASAIIVFLIIAIFYFLRQDWLPGAIVILGTIVQGAAVTWVSNNRTKAVQEEEDALKAIKAYQEKKKQLDTLVKPSRVELIPKPLKGKEILTPKPGEGRKAPVVVSTAERDKKIGDLTLDMQQMTQPNPLEDITKLADDFKLIGNIR